MARYLLIEEDVTKGTDKFTDKVEAAIAQGWRPIGGPLLYSGSRTVGHTYRNMVQALYSDTEIGNIAAEEAVTDMHAGPQPKANIDADNPEAKTADTAPPADSGAVADIAAPPETDTVEDLSASPQTNAHKGKGKGKK